MKSFERARQRDCAERVDSAAQLLLQKEVDEFENDGLGVVR